MKIGFDLDGVLYPWHTVLYEYMRDSGKIDGLTFQEFWISYKTILPEERMKLLVDNVDFYIKRNIDQSILSMLNRLANEHTIYYITSRPQHAWYSTHQWARRNKLPFRENLITMEGNGKDLYIIENEIEIYTDDRIDILERVKPYCNTILVRQPYNDYGFQDWTYVNNILDVERIINERF